MTLIVSIRTAKIKIDEAINCLTVYAATWQRGAIMTLSLIPEAEQEISGMGTGKPRRISAGAIYSRRVEDFASPDPMHPQRGNYLTGEGYHGIYRMVYTITSSNEANALQGKTGIFAGYHDLHLITFRAGSRIDGPPDYSKYQGGNISLE